MTTETTPTKYRKAGFLHGYFPKAIRIIEAVFRRYARAIFLPNFFLDQRSPFVVARVFSPSVFSIFFLTAVFLLLLLCGVIAR